jgi:hypothetical protein
MRTCHLYILSVCNNQRFTRYWHWATLICNSLVTLHCACCRQAVESEAEEIYASAAHEDVAFLVVGDPFCATTHTDLMMRAHELGIKV